MTNNPNIILIFADDLGRGMLSCYGQQHFETPNIDRLANEGMKFNHAYGCAFCAPSRASMLTGIHDCHEGTWTYTQGGLYNIPDIHPAVKQSSELTTFEKEYASMILKLDETVGIILDELERLGIDDRTMVVFSADNGHEVYYRLYHLPNDYREENDISADHPDLVARLSGWMRNACDGDYQNGTPQAHLAAYPDF